MEASPPPSLILKLFLRVHQVRLAGDGKDIFAHHAIDPSWLASLLIVMEPPQKVSFDPGGVYAILLAHLPTLILNW